MYLNTTVAVDAYGDWYVGASNMTASAQDYNFGFYARTNSTATGNANNYAANNNKRRIVTMRNLNTAINGSNSDRVKIPRIVVQHTNTSNTTQASNTNRSRILMSFFDSNCVDNDAIFLYGTLGAANNWGGNITEGTANATSQGYYSTKQIVANDLAAQTHKGSIYTAVGVLTNGVPVIAWYDRTNQRLVFSYGDAVPGASGTAGNIVSRTTTQWQNSAVIVKTYAGTHVDMAVDSDDGIHLAYYDVFNGGLWYSYIPHNGGDVNLANGSGSRRPSPGANGANIITRKVDTYLSAGTKLMINVRKEGTNQVPYISYFHASFAETKNAIRVAWPVKFPILDGTDSQDSFLGNWEAMTVPAGTVPVSDEFVCNGVPSAFSTSSSGAASGWLGPTYNAGTARSTLRTTPENSILVGYMTSNWYEGAILKYNIRSSLGN
jgi:hypothetical protein